MRAAALAAAAALAQLASPAPASSAASSGGGAACPAFHTQAECSRAAACRWIGGACTTPKIEHMVVLCAYE